MSAASSAHRCRAGCSPRESQTIIRDVLPSPSCRRLGFLGSEEKQEILETQGWNSPGSAKSSSAGAGGWSHPAQYFWARGGISFSANIQWWGSWFQQSTQTKEEPVKSLLGQGCYLHLLPLTSRAHTEEWPELHKNPSRGQAPAAWAAFGKFSTEQVRCFAGQVRYFAGAKNFFLGVSSDKQHPEREVRTRGRMPQLPSASVLQVGDSPFPSKGKFHQSAQLYAKLAWNEGQICMDGKSITSLELGFCNTGAWKTMLLLTHNQSKLDYFGHSQKALSEKTVKCLNKIYLFKSSFQIKELVIYSSNSYSIENIENLKI